MVKKIPLIPKTSMLSYTKHLCQNKILLQFFKGREDYMDRAIVWFRQDLRLADNPALYYAALENKNIIPLYILDESLPWSIGEAQKWWLHYSLKSLQEQFKKLKMKLILKRGKAKEILLKLCQENNITAIYWNRCYEPAALERDIKLKAALTSHRIKAQSYNGSLLYEPWEIANNQGNYFKVFTPFWKHCYFLPVAINILPTPTLKQKNIFIKSDSLATWNLLPSKPNWAIGFDKNWQPGELNAQKQLKQFIGKLLQNYSEKRDFPGEIATSRLSPHLHFGEISPRQIWQKIKLIQNRDIHLFHEGEHFLRQLGWREFSYHLLYHFPKFAEENFREKFDYLPWLNNKSLLSCWQKGQTGYPIVDAGMRELWYSGYMHNRVRMITASFLTKHLLIDWRKGAKWFWDTLVDADLANNSMGWQWVAGSGVDAAPYFRIFNPYLQGEKFDAKGKYVRQWIPELEKLSNKYLHQPWKAPAKILQAANINLGKTYPKPIVDHNFARSRALASYQKMNKLFIK